MIPTHGWTPRDPKSLTNSTDDCERCHSERPVSMDSLCLVCHSARESRRIAAARVSIMMDGGLDKVAAV